MQVNNTFTSLIADLPYPNTKANHLSNKLASSTEQSNTQTVQNNNSQDKNIHSPPPSDNKNTTNSVNILV